MSIQHTAYLVAHIYTDPTGRMHPQVHAVRIYSEGATSLSYVAKDAAMVDVYHVDGDTYQEASDYLRFCVQTMAPFAWCRPLMGEQDRREVQYVTFGEATAAEREKAVDVVREWRSVDMEHARRTVRFGIYLDRERYEHLVNRFVLRNCDVPVLWNAQSEAA